MADILMVAGDSFEHPMTLEDDKVPISINTSSTVEAALLDQDDVVLIPATTVSSATAGSDWAQGKIVVKFTSTQTTISNVPKLVRVEVQIATTIGSKTTYKSDWFELAFGAIV